MSSISQQLTVQQASHAALKRSKEKKFTFTKFWFILLCFALSQPIIFSL